MVLQPRLCEADSSISSLSAACQCNTKLKTERDGGLGVGKAFLIICGWVGLCIIIRETK